jgi:hypothetical protein
MRQFHHQPLRIKTHIKFIYFERKVSKVLNLLYLCRKICVNVPNGMRIALLMTVFVAQAAVAAGQTAAEFLSIVPDARTAALGGAGVALSPDANAQHLNTARYAFSQNSFGAAVSYIPWMLPNAGDMVTYYGAGFGRFGRTALSLAVRYANMGDIILTPDGIHTNTLQLSDYAIDVGYARQIIPWLSAGLTLRYLSIVRAEQGGVVPSGAFAADASVYYRQKFSSHTVTAGLSLLNVGDKVNIGGVDASLPVSVNMGVGWTLAAEEHHISMLFNVAQPLTAAHAEGNPSLPQAALGVGVEYGFRQRLFARFGYLHSAREYDDLSHLSFGAGVLLGGLSIDAAYLFSVADREGAIVNTLRVTVGVAFGQVKDIKTTKRTWKPLRKAGCNNCPY